METEFSISEEYASFLFCIAGFSYAIGSPFVSVVSLKTGRKISSLLGLALGALGYVLLGPVPFLNTAYGQRYALRYANTVVAQLFAGWGCALSFVPSLPMMIDYATLHGMAAKKATGPCSGTYNQHMAASTMEMEMEIEMEMEMEPCGRWCCY